MIPFNKPSKLGTELDFVRAALDSEKISGDGDFSRKSQQWFQDHLKCKIALLTPSCTAALEMAALLIDIHPGDEVIMPSYTFVSTANAFVLRGAKIVFVDIRPDSMNIDETLIEPAITNKTKAIVAVHYAGVACEMDTIIEIADRYGLYVIEDAAQGMMATYKGRPLGSIGHMGAYSFHETKNYTSGGEGGLFIVNDERFSIRAEVIREKGTNRSQFFRGMVDKYSWIDMGSSYLASELQAAYLWAQLEGAGKINQARQDVWSKYKEELHVLQKKDVVELPQVPEECVHNAHMFYVKARDLKERTGLIEHLKERKIQAVFHYVPLHSAIGGKKFGRFHGEDNYTTKESERLLRLPLWYGMSQEDVLEVVSAIKAYYH